MTNDRFKPDLEELRTRFDAYGADMTRWPQAARARAEAAVGVDPQVARMLAESKALDAVLAHAPLPSSERRYALAERIVAEAGRAAPEAPRSIGHRGKEDTPSGVVIPWPGARRVPSPAAAVPAGSWRSLGLLAASLAVGIFIGALDLAPASVDQLVEAVDYGTDFDQLAAVYANDGLVSALDEDLL